MPDARIVPGAGAAEASGAVVVVDVLRAFSTAAYAVAAGVARIWLVRDVADAFARRTARPELLLAGEDGGRRIEGFDFPNSPAAFAALDLTGRELVLRTSAGTRGVVEATRAQRRWCTGLVCASATARAVTAAALGAPTYIATGWRGEDRPGHDDVETARFVEAVRTGAGPDPVAVAHAVAHGDEAGTTLALGPGHVDPRDIELATVVDAFDFALEARPTPAGLELVRVEVPTV